MAEVGHRHHVDPAELVPLEQYRRDLLGRVAPLEPIELALLEAHGCVLAEDVTAAEDVPPFRNSAMDGYAVHAEDAVEGARLRVVGEVAAGASGAVDVGVGEAVRIMTGAPVPEGVDAVVPVEVAAEDGDDVVIGESPGLGANIRPAGESVRAGDTVLRAGRRLGPGDVGMLASLGLSQVLVRPRPRVVVIATGDELVDIGAEPAPGQIRDSNSVMLTAMARDAGATAFRHELVPDERRALTDAIEGALVQGDLVVTSGGVSAGRYDLVKRVLADLGDVTSCKVGIQPGMPQAFGFIAGVPTFGLPGNPVSAFVSFEVFVRPALRRLQGRRDLTRPRVSAVLDEPVHSPAHKVSFLRVALERRDDGWHAMLTGGQGSGILRSVVDADGLAEVPADVTQLAAGSRVVVHLLVEAQ